MINDMVVVLGRVFPITTDKIHQNQEVFDINGCIGTIKSTHYKDPPKVLVMEVVNE